MRIVSTLAALLASATATAQVPRTPASPPMAMRAPMPPTPPTPPHLGMAFGAMSEAGRTTMMAAQRGDRDADRADHDRVRTARDRMLGLLGAERLDAAALKRAMDDEREAANAMKARRQAALFTAFQSLSVADRKAFVEDARNLRHRIERRVDRRMHRSMKFRGDHGMTTPIPPVPPQPPR